MLPIFSKSEILRLGVKEISMGKDSTLQFGRDNFSSTGALFAIIKNALKSNPWCKAAKFLGPEKQLLLQCFFIYLLF